MRNGIAAVLVSAVVSVLVALLVTGKPAIADMSFHEKMEFDSLKSEVDSLRWQVESLKSEVESLRRNYDSFRSDASGELKKLCERVSKVEGKDGILNFHRCRSFY